MKLSLLLHHKHLQSKVYLVAPFSPYLVSSYGFAIKV